MITRIQGLETYADRAKQYLQSREDALVQIPESEIKDALGSEEYNIDTTADVLYPELASSEEKFYNFTGFTTSEFEHLLATTCQNLIFQGRGRKARVSEKDTLIILLHYLRRYPKMEEFSTVLGIHVSSMERLIDRSINALWEYMYRKLVSLPSIDTELPTDPNFPEASLIVDATVQQINIPGLTFEERKPWFSGKHLIYCLKSQVTVNMKGIAVHVISGIKGAVHDLEVFRTTLPEIEAILKTHPKMPQKVLADKGYVSDIPCLITPHKGANLTRTQKVFNDRISKHRIVVENFYGRLKSRYAIIGGMYLGTHSNFL